MCAMNMCAVVLMRMVNLLRTESVLLGRVSKCDDEIQRSM